MLEHIITDSYGYDNTLISDVKSNTLLENALDYARRGWRVFPCHSPQHGRCSCGKDVCNAVGKHPLIKKNLAEATTDENKIRAWWTKWPDANIAIATGVESGLMVLDVDPRHGGDESLVRLQEEIGSLGETLISNTGGGGRHFLFKYCSGLTSRSNALGAGFKGLDIKADGGYIIAPQSLHESGRSYNWANQLPLAEFPSRLAAKLDKASVKPFAAPIVGTVKEGQRDQVLISLAGSMRRRGMASEAMVAALQVENKLRFEPPVDDDQIIAKVNSVCRYGAEDPYLESVNLVNQLSNAELSDAGNAESFAAIHETKLRYDHTRKKWLLWDGVRWRIDDKERVTQLAIETARVKQQIALQQRDRARKETMVKAALKSESARGIRDMLDIAKSLPPFPMTADQFDAEHFLAVTKNGTLDLSARLHRASNHEDYLTLQLGAEHDATATCPRWELFLAEIFNNDEELIEYVQKIVGYSLTGDTSEQKLFICYGTGANGKSVLLQIIGALLGDYAGTASFDTFDAANRGKVSNDLAALKGKRLVTVVESEEGRRLAEAKVKSVTGQDVITCRFLYQEFFQYLPQYKIMMAVNHKPDINPVDEGIWRRVRLIPFNQKFTGREDRDLIRKLSAELSGILNWALQGLKKYQSDGLTEPRVVEEATTEYRRECDSIADWLDERTEKSAVSIMRASEGYRDYSTWAKDLGRHPYGVKKWAASLVARGYLKGRDSHGVYYSGLKLEYM